MGDLAELGTCHKPKVPRTLKLKLISISSLKLFKLKLTSKEYTSKKKSKTMIY